MLASQAGFGYLSVLTVNARNGSLYHFTPHRWLNDKETLASKSGRGTDRESHRANLELEVDNPCLLQQDARRWRGI